ncbi:hypothetical protein PIB30_077831 [Stylosanthes scabra]|uniref:PGG domain-containing protein n=1 Tax=Stylosanthes scabra TaxID=79078 RepID=A0ABU6ZPB5_9FABA|nr:hypothetical protein [Stylosanthes scabra]
MASPKWKSSEGQIIKEWMKNYRGYLGMVATVIATMALQNGLNPPGGVVQNGNDGSILCPTPMGHGQACPGQSVFAVVDPVGYIWFMLANIISFLLSLIACLLIISGKPLSSRYDTPILMILTSLSLSLLLLSLGLGLRVLNPHTSQTIGEIAVYGSLVTVLIVFIRLFLALIQKTQEEDEVVAKKEDRPNHHGQGHDYPSYE